MKWGVSVELPHLVLAPIWTHCIILLAFRHHSSLLLTYWNVESNAGAAAAQRFMLTSSRNTVTQPEERVPSVPTTCNRSALDGEEGLDSSTQLLGALLFQGCFSVFHFGQYWLLSTSTGKSKEVRFGALQFLMFEPW